MSLPRSPIHLIGKRFTKLVVSSLRHAKRPSSGLWYYVANCKCDCGAFKEIDTTALKAGRTGSCGCSKDRYLKTTGENNVNFKGYRGIRAHFWNGYRMGAANRSLPFELTMEYAWDLYEQQKCLCALSGIPIGFGATSKNSNTSASLDRIDNAKGYVEGNVQWVHKSINLMRNVLTVEKFIEWCKRVANNSNGNK